MFTPLNPSRILDTRVGIGAAAEQPAPGSVLTVPVAGKGGVPSAGVTAVVLNLTVTRPQGPGFVQVLPAGSTDVGAYSNLNVYFSEQIASNLVTVPLGEGGAVSLADQAGTHLILDVFGYYSPSSASAAGRFQPVGPTRLIDTRNRTGLPPVPRPASPGDAVNCGNFATWSAANDWFWTYYDLFGDVADLDGNDDLVPCEALRGNPGYPVRRPGLAFDPNPKPASGETITVPISGRAGVPARGASAVVLSVTGTGSNTGGYVQVSPAGLGTPLGATSNVNLNGANDTAANMVIVPLGGGAVELKNYGGTHILVDVMGYFTDATAPTTSTGLFVPLDPARLADTRTSGVKPGWGSTTVVDPRGRGGVPATGASSLFLNATITESATAGYLQILPAGATPGGSSNLNYSGANQTIAVAAIGSSGAGGSIAAYVYASTHVIIDVFGYYTDGTAPPPPDPLNALTIAPKFAGSPYNRDDYGGWIDADSDCQDTRQEVLLQESTTPTTLDGSGCHVVSGTWVDPYTGTAWTDPSDLDIDHMVPLSNAHESGAWAWDAARKRDYANDLDDPWHLIAVEDNLNQSKGDKGPEDWKPPATGYWCQYATDWVKIKTTWALTVTQDEHDALAQMLSTC